MKKYLIQFLLFLSLLGSAIYLIPSKEITFKGKSYAFTNLPSLDKKQENLELNLTRLENHYQYTLESAVSIAEARQWTKDAAKDQKTLERRVESLIGNKYEVRLDNIDNRIVFNIFTSENLGTNSQVLSISNTDLKVSAKETSLVTLDANATETPEGETKNVDLNFKRSDFGIAEINISDEAQGAELQVRLPLGLIGPEKIKEINNRAASTLDITIGSNTYTGRFSINPNTFSITHLAISPVSSMEDAKALRALLNTGNYNFAYNVTQAKEVKNNNGTQKLGLFLLFTLFSAILINKLTLNNLSGKKLFYIFSFTLIGLALTKLFGVVVTDGYIFLLSITILLTIFSSRYTYYVLILGLLILTKLLGYLYYMDLKWSQIILLILMSVAIWSTNYIKKVNKKYA